MCDRLLMKLARQKRLSTKIVLKWVKLNAEPVTYQVLCENF